VTTKIGLGLAAIGRPEYINIRETNPISKTEKAFKTNAFEIMDYAYNIGTRHFDTAPSYGKGESFLIEWSRTRNYPDVVLSTKWGYTYVANWKLGFEGKHEVKEHSLDKLIEQWEVSQNLLPTLKFYQVHSATLDSGIFENQEVLEHLYFLKKTLDLKIGITSSGANQSEIISEALKIKIEGSSLFDSFQVTYNILDTSTHNILTKILDQDKTIIIKEALANGRIFTNNRYPHYKKLYNYLETIADKYGVGVDAIAMRFIIDNLNPNIVLSGASNKTQLSENLKAFDFKLTKDEIAKFKAFSIPAEKYWDERNQLNWN
jgi:aryl-alcohol dehydrogenase-like predicted oxidoreductase